MATPRATPMAILPNATPSATPIAVPIANRTPAVEEHIDLSLVFLSFIDDINSGEYENIQGILRKLPQ
jgi:hypothetical protein